MKTSILAIAPALFLGFAAAAEGLKANQALGRRQANGAAKLQEVKRDSEEWDEFDIVTATVTKTHYTCPCDGSTKLVSSPPSVKTAPVKWIEYDYSYTTTKVCAAGGSCYESKVTSSSNPRTVTKYVPGHETTYYHTAYSTYTATACDVCQPHTTSKKVGWTAVETVPAQSVYTRTHTAYETYTSSACAVCQAQTLTKTAYATVMTTVAPPATLTHTYSVCTTITTSTCPVCSPTTITQTAYTTVTQAASATLTVVFLNYLLS